MRVDKRKYPQSEALGGNEPFDRHLPKHKELGATWQSTSF